MSPVRRPARWSARTSSVSLASFSTVSVTLLGPGCARGAHRAHRQSRSDRDAFPVTSCLSSPRCTSALISVSCNSTIRQRMPSRRRSRWRRMRSAEGDGLVIGRYRIRCAFIPPSGSMMKPRSAALGLLPRWDRQLAPGGWTRRRSDPGRLSFNAAEVMTPGVCRPTSIS